MSNYIISHYSYIVLYIFRYLCLSFVCSFDLHNREKHTVPRTERFFMVPSVWPKKFQFGILQNPILKNGSLSTTVAELDEYMLCSTPQQPIQSWVHEYLLAYRDSFGSSLDLVPLVSKSFLQCLNRFPDTEIPSLIISHQFKGTPVAGNLENQLLLISINWKPLKPSNPVA